MTTIQRANALFAILVAVCAGVLMLVGPELLPKTQKHDPIYTSPLFFSLYRTGYYFDQRLGPGG